MKSTTLFPFLLSLIPSIFFVLSPLAYAIPQNMDDTLPVFVGSLVCLLSLAVLLAGKAKRPFRLRLNWIDIGVAGYLLYAAIRLLAGGLQFVEPVTVVEWTVLAAIYLLCRNLPSRERTFLPWLIAVGGAVQALVGMLQWGGILANRNALFPVTGTFANPGPYGGFLAVAALCAFHAWRWQGFALSRKTLLLPVALLCILPALFLSDSRTAWLAFLLPALAAFLKNKKAWGKMAAAALLVCGVILLYLYKKPSADARLLVWQSATGMFADHPLVGVGSGGFAANYMDCQAEFLDRHPDSPYILQADNNLLAFNDWLRLLCEQGALGGLLVLLVLVAAFRTPVASSMSFARAGLASWAVFACFSYPASVFALKTCLPLFLGCLAAERRPVCEQRLSRLAIMPATAVLFAGLWLSVDVFLHYRAAYQKLYSNAYLGEPFDPQAEPFRHMFSNKHFLYALSEQYLDAGRLDDALRVKQRLAVVAPASSLHCDIGMLLLEQGNPEAAVAHFTQARRMTPNHITPAYGLLLAAERQQNGSLCQQLAQSILQMPVRVVNNTVLKARHKARTFLKQHDSQTATKTSRS